MSRAAQAAFVFLVSTSTCRPSSATHEPVVPAADDSARTAPPSDPNATPTVATNAASAPSATPTEQPRAEDPSPPNQVNIYGMSCMGILREVVFDFQSAKISESQAPTLQVLKEVMELYPSFIFELRGHADAKERRAVELSKRRARAVRDALIEKGFRPEALSLVSCGAEAPLAESGDGKNRRVQFVLVGSLTETEEICDFPKPAECRDFER